MWKCLVMSMFLYTSNTLLKTSNYLKDIKAALFHFIIAVYALF